MVETDAARLERIAGQLYNKGLYAAREGRLTDAIDALSKSLAFNAQSIDARNLLGLCCLQVGRLTDALLHWVLSAGLKKTGNRAATYLSLLEDRRFLDRMSDATEMYNQGLEYARQNSGDYAVIQLKRALEICPNMIDALNLLALLHLHAKERHKAAGYIHRALSLDRNNKLALSYFHMLTPEHRPPQNAPAPTAGKARRDPAWKPERPYAPAAAQLIGFFIGAACALAVAFLLIWPSRVQTFRQQQDELTTRYGILETSANSAAKEAQAREDALNAQLAEAGAKIEAMEAERDAQTRVQQIQKAHNWFLEGRAEDAWTYLQTISPDGLPRESYDLWQQTRQSAAEALTTQYWDEAMARYNAKAYAEAAALFEKTLTYRADSPRETYYYLARCLEAQNEGEAALQHYKIAIEETGADATAYPWLTDAKRRADALEQ